MKGILKNMDREKEHFMRRPLTPNIKTNLGENQKYTNRRTIFTRIFIGVKMYEAVLWALNLHG